MRSRFTASAAALLTASCTCAQSLTGLGHLFGGTYTEGAAISGDGQVVIGSGSTPQGSRGFRWTAAGGLATLGPDVFEASALNRYGAVVVCAGNPWGYRWTAAGGLVPLSGLPGSIFSHADAVSDDGFIIAGYSGVTGNFHATRWNGAGVVQDLGALPGHLYSLASGISGDGSVVAGRSGADHLARAFRWTAADGMTSLGVLPGLTTSLAYAVSGDGAVIVGSCGIGSEERAFRWTAATGMAGLGPLPAEFVSSRALAVNADGSVIVGMGQSFTGLRAFIWTPGRGMQDLRVVLEDAGVNLAIWKLAEASGVSRNGTVLVGSGFRNGIGEAWTATIRCYADCNEDGAANLADFGCFTTKFALGDPYADCNGDGIHNLADFGCFTTKFAFGCP